MATFGAGGGARGTYSGLYVYENIGSRKRARLAPAKKLTLDPGLAPPVHPEGLRFTPEPGVLVTQWRCRPVVVDWNKDGLPD